MSQITQPKSKIDWYLAGFTSKGHYLTVHRILQEGYDRYYQQSSSEVPPILNNILAVPAVMSERSEYLTTFLRDIKQNPSLTQYHTKKVMFDSGGFQIRHKFTLEEIYELNLKLYLKYNYANYYFMVDHPPTIEDTTEARLSKVKASIKYSLKLFDQLPPELQERSISVLHCYNDDISEIELQLEGYRPILEASPWVAFSFAKPHMSLLGKVFLLRHLLTNTRALSDMDLKFHILGLHGLAIYICSLLGIESYDTSNPRINSCYGKIGFPGQSTVSVNSLTNEQLAEIKRKTNHDCPFCQDIEVLQTDHKFLSLHNLVAFYEFNELVSNNQVTLETFDERNQQILNNVDNPLISKSDQLELF